MATTKIPDPVLETRGPSHWITRNNHDPYDTETITFRFTTEWRGDPVTVTVEARRTMNGWNRDDLHWSDWQIWSREAGRFDPESEQYPSAYRDPVSDTARQRLRAACEPSVRAWIDSNDYDRSRARAIADLVKSELPSVRYNRARTLLATLQTEVTSEDYDRLATMIEALEVYAAAYEAD